MKNSAAARKPFLIVTGLFILTVVLMTVSMLLISGLKKTNHADAAASAEVQKSYTTVTVHEGDTLWTLAEDYNAAGSESTEAYIREVSRLNHLGSADEIHAGAHIVIPCYSTNER